MIVRFASLCSAALLFSSAAAAQVAEIPSKEAAAKALPRDLSAQTALGVAYLRAGRFKDADKQLERAEALAKGDPAAMMRRAEVAIVQGDYKRARGLCKQLFTEDKVPPLAHVCMARAFLAWNRSERAFEELQAALGEDPNLGEAQLVLGHAHRIRSQVTDAETAYARAKENAGLEAEANLGLGRLYAAAGRKAQAIEALRAALMREPNWPEVQYELGLLLDGNDEARELFSQALAGRPDWAEPARALGDVLRQAGEMSGAEAAYRKALAAEPDLSAAHAGLGEVLFAAGRLDEAEAVLRRALGLVPNDPRCMLGLAEIQVKRGLVEEAVEQFRQAADRDPRNPVGLLRAAEVLVANQRTTLAAGFLDRLLATHPQNAKGLTLYGDVMRARGDKASATRYYERAVSAGGQVDPALLQGR